jgi:ATP-dependent DNA helicase RecG
MHKLGLKRDIDLALHLPMRYEDETRLTPIASVRDFETAQVQGVVRECRVETRGRRQLVVRLADASGELVLRLLHFYPSQQKALGVGQTACGRVAKCAAAFSAARWCTPNSAPWPPAHHCRRR